MKEAIQAYEAKNKILMATNSERKSAIINIAKKLSENFELIIEANKVDLNLAKENNLSNSLMDRLEINEQRLRDLIASVEEIANQPEVVGEILETTTRDDGLKISKQRVPIGVIGMIFESRPNVVIDCSCLAIKSGNCIILKGGKEAQNSNNILVETVREAIKEFIPINSVQLISSRDDVSELLKQNKYIDVIIPRGGENLINFVYKNSLIPVIAHFKGVCHIFIDECFEIQKAIDICVNAKTQRPGVCNAVETVLLHESISQENIEKLLTALANKNCELRICENTKSKIAKVKPATQEDWDTEYLDNILSLKTVKNIDEAISHIQKHGSHHTEAILSNNKENIQTFMNQVDASSIMINASTRFNDGGEYGLGAELGISTTKLHAYGPMGAKEMTTTRFIVEGQGHIRS